MLIEKKEFQIPVQKQKKLNDQATVTSEEKNYTEKLTNILALMLVKGEPQPDQIKLLSLAGYTNNEISTLLSVKPNTVKVTLYRIRRES